MALVTRVARATYEVDACGRAVRPWAIAVVMACALGLVPTFFFVAVGVDVSLPVVAVWVAVAIMPGAIGAALASSTVRCVRLIAQAAGWRVAARSHAHPRAAGFILHLPFLLSAGGFFWLARLFDLDANIRDLVGVVTVLAAGFTVIVLGLTVATIGAHRPAAFFTAAAQPSRQTSPP